MNPRKALGEALTGLDIFNCAPLEMGAYFHPLYFETIVLAHAPVFSKGGQSMDLKKIPIATQPTHIRGVRLEDPDPPRYGAHLRQHTLSVVDFHFAKT